MCFWKGEQGVWIMTIKLQDRLKNKEHSSETEANQNPAVKCKVGDAFTWDRLVFTYAEFGEYTKYSE